MKSRMGSRGTIVLTLAVVAVLLVVSGTFVPGRPGPSPSTGFTATVTHPGTSALPAVRAPTAAPRPDLAVPSWVNVTRSGPNASPPGTWLGSLAYDPVDQEVVAFGGCDISICPQNYTWVFSHGVWTNITNPQDAPPARYAATMDFDPNMGGLLLFGGLANSGYLNDTWLFSGGAWTNLSWVGPAPSIRGFASMTFDPDPEVNGSVVWGGFNPSVGDVNDTWVWQSWAGWVHLNTTIDPPAAELTSLVYDPADSALVLYGAGYTSSTWELQGGQWWQVNTPGPPFRYGAGAVYVPGASAVFLFGGLNGSTFLNDSWSFSGGTWSNDTSGFVAAPPARAFVGLTLDPSGSVPLLFGGANAALYFNDTWAIATEPSAALAAAPGTSEVTTNVTFTATVSGGIPPYVATFHFGDNVTAMVSGNGSTLVVSHAFINPGSYTAWVNVTDSVGLTSSALASPVTVSAGPAISASATPSVVDVGQSVAFSATATSPGIPPIAYQWTFGDGQGAPGATPSHSYSAPGTYPVSVIGTDADGVPANASLVITVVPLPTLTAGDNRSSATVDDPIAFYANLSGGTAPYRFSWNFGDGNRSTFPSPFHVFSTAGNFTVEVWTNDSFSVMDHESLTVSIHSASSQQPPPAGNNTTVTRTVTGGVPSWFYPALGGLVAAGLVGCVLIAWRARAGRSS